MTMCDLATAVENKIDVKFAILNNGTLGMVHQWQDLFYERDYFSTVYSGNPDFVKLAEAYGITGLRVTRRDQVSDVIQQALETPGPVVVDFVVKRGENVYPMIPAGESINEMMESPPVGPTG
jgi:acetolactate synthase-1/2/3 large subunit